MESIAKRRLNTISGHLVDNAILTTVPTAGEEGITIQDLKKYVGKEIGVSKWHKIDQKQSIIFLIT